MSAQFDSSFTKEQVDLLNIIVTFALSLGLRAEKLDLVEEGLNYRFTGSILQEAEFESVVSKLFGKVVAGHFTRNNKTVTFYKKDKRI